MTTSNEARLQRRLTGKSPRPSTEAVRTTTRILLAVLLSGLADLLVWQMSSKQLSGHINFVGYPTFTNYDDLTVFLKYRLATYAFPVGVIVFYSLLAWRGPLRAKPTADRSQPVPLIVPGDVSVVAPSTAAPASHASLAPATTALLRPVGPALVVVLASSVLSRQVAPVIGWSSVAYGCGYVLVVLALAWMAVVATARSSNPRNMSFSDSVSVVNVTAGAVAAFGGLWLVSHNTEVMLSNGSVQRWSWLPWWLAALGVVGAWAWVVRELRRGRSAALIDQRLRIVLVGSVAMYLLVAEIVPQIGYLQGFDDSQGLTGALLLQHGYFPWRDFQFIHGFFVDVGESLIGFHIFGETAWGSYAGIDLILVPLSWVGLYLLGVWGARRGALAVLAPLFLAAYAGLGIDPRFILLPLVWALLGKALGSQRSRWICGLTIVLFVEAIAVPEADLQVLAVAVVIVGADLAHRRPGRPLTENLRRTLYFVATGAILTVAWVAFLASQHALNAFIDWFKIFVPGHDVEGAVPLGPIGAVPSVMFKAMIVLVILTFLSSAWRLHRRLAWTPLAWVTLGAAINAGVYGEQALGRYDAPHVTYSLDAALPLFVLVVASLMPAVDRFLLSQTPGLKRLSQSIRFLAQPASLAALVVGVLIAPSVRFNVLHLPNRTRTQVGPQTHSKLIGYAAAGVPAVGLLADLRSVLDRYAPKDAPFFDMTNSPGYFYYLLGRRPAAPFTNISQAIPEGAQQLLVGDLRKTRPPLIAFNSATIGLPGWDGVENQVRHFEVSQYVLNGWKPLLVTQSVLFLLRDDLISHRPRLPHLSVAPVTTDLYNSQGECNWGDSANFLESLPSGPSVTAHALRVTVVPAAAPTHLIEFRLPGHAPLSGYELATLEAKSQIGTSALTVSDVSSLPAGADISATALPVTGSRLSVRVGSCLPWHGYRGRTLYVEQQGGAPITSLTLSRVQS